MIKVTHHSIDRASLRMMNLWITESKKGEGLVRWLSGFAAEAIEKGEKINANQYRYLGNIFTYDFNENETILVTVYNDNGCKKAGNLEV